MSSSWGFAGWGHHEEVQVLRIGRDLVSRVDKAAPPKDDSGGGKNISGGAHDAKASGEPSHAASLGQIPSTAIAGNDLLSSCLYTGGICAGYAGSLAPLALFLVSVMLYFFRSVYAEVVTAMPVNGGSYTALTNTTSKRVASIAACMSMISYIATAVVSAESAVQYLQLPSPLYVHALDNQTGLIAGTIVVLGIFAALNLWGISESASVATVMFVVHVTALLILIVWSFAFAIKNKWEIFLDNCRAPFPSGASWSVALYFGYSSALLGITGFETAANYVEEMKDSQTYVRTLRNMWYSVAFFNPILGLLSMAVLPLSEIYNYPLNLLGPVAKVVGGDGLEAFIVADGVLVLCGSVLTGYVGVVGLVRRMAMDRCLPSFLLSTNSWRGTNHYIIVGFFALASSLVTLLNGDVQMLGSVYNIAFLSVMTAFAISCLILKWKRPHLPRLVISPVSYVLLAIFFVVAGLIGNVVRSPIVLAWFFVYFGAVSAVVFTMFNRTTLLRGILAIAESVLASPEELAQRKVQMARLIQSHRIKEEATAALLERSLLSDTDEALNAEADVESSTWDYEEFGVNGLGGVLKERETASPTKVQGWRLSILKRIRAALHDINNRPLVFFSKTSNLETLNKAIKYVRENEQTRRLIVVHVVDDSAVARAASHIDELSRPTPSPNSVFDEVVFPELPPLSADAKLLITTVAMLDATYPKLRVDLLLVRGTSFGPLAIRWVSKHLGIKPADMFMAMPDEYFAHRFSALGGLRVITRSTDAAERALAGEHTRRVLAHAASELLHTTLGQNQAATPRNGGATTLN